MTLQGCELSLTLPLTSELETTWHQARVVFSEMIHFIRQMQAHSQLEVIACSWKDLVEFAHHKEGDLDALIDTHRSYLETMVRKVLYLNAKGKKEVRSFSSC